MIAISLTRASPINIQPLSAKTGAARFWRGFGTEQIGRTIRRQDFIWDRDTREESANVRFYRASLLT
ncbi:MAG: hypothetical protein ACLR23_19405, partial [Clostridia bacterium]